MNVVMPLGMRRFGILPERKPPLTIIAALRESEQSLLLAADSGGEETPGIRLQNEIKLRRHDNYQIAWGGSGNPQIALDFSNNLQATKRLPGTWYDCSRKIANILGVENDRRRKAAEASGVRELPAAELTDILLVGWINNIPEIIELSDNGGILLYLSLNQKFHAIGTGKPYAYAAFNALSALNRGNHLEHLKVVIGVTARIAPQCDIPTHIWRITPTDIEEVGN